MKLIFKLLAISTLFIMTNLWAHPDGHEETQTLYKQQAIEASIVYRNKMIEAGTLDSQWKEANVSNAELKRVDYRNSWVVSYSLTNSKKTLEIIMTSTGVLISSEQGEAQ
jgi:hypothetical protein